MGDKIGITLKETSTWVSLIGLLALFGINIAPEYTAPIAEVAAGVASIIGIFTRRSDAK